MNSTNIQRMAPLRARTGAIAAALLGACAAVESQAAMPAFVLSVYGDQSSGELIMAGKHRAAYAQLAHGGTGAAGDALSWQMNLCAAATLVKQMAVAQKACDQAVWIARSECAYSPYWSQASNSAADTALEMAYSNRGILRWLNGQTSDAQADFSKAIEIAPGDKLAAQNNEVMHARHLASVQADQGL